MDVAATTSSLTGSTSAQSQGDAFGQLQAEDFIKMLVAQLQSQDPLNPTENQDLLAQMSEIRSLSTSDKMTQTFTQLLAQQRLAAGASLIGKTISGKTADGDAVVGVVERVSINGDQVDLVVDGQVVPLANVTEVR